MRGTLEEILAGEVLTRVWTAVLCLYDRQHGGYEFESLARSIMIGHLEARHRVLMLLVRGPGISAESAVKLNHLRRRAERWSDLLVGYLIRYGDVAEFAIDADRAVEFSQDLEFQTDQEGGRQAWPLLQASIRTAFQRGLAPVSPHEDLNAQIAAAILSCFPGDLFDSTGLFRSLWLHRMSNVTSDVQGMIETLVGSGPGERRKAWRSDRDGLGGKPKTLVLIARPERGYDGLSYSGVADGRRKNRHHPRSRHRRPTGSTSSRKRDFPIVVVPSKRPSATSWTACGGAAWTRVLET